MTRILQVCNTNFYLVKFLAPLVRALVADGYEVDCVCEGVPDTTLLGPGVRVMQFDFPRASSPLAFARTIERLRAVIRSGNYDCVDSHNRNASIVARIAAMLEKVPVNLYTAHGFYFHDDQKALAHWATVRLEAALAKVTDFTLSQSQEDVTFMTARGFILPHRIEEIRNGIDTRRFSPRPAERAELEKELGLRSGRFRIATTGRLVKGKGFTDLLDAVALLHAEVPEVELLLIGGNIEQDISPYQSAFLARAKEAGVQDALVVTGIVDTVERYLATADVFVLPSYREGMPRSLLEGMSMELASVATDIRGCREAIEPGRSGLLFPPHDVARLAQLLRELYRSPELRRSLGSAARLRAVGSFDEADYVARQVAAIRRLVGSPRSRIRTKREDARPSSC